MPTVTRIADHIAEAIKAKYPKEVADESFNYAVNLALSKFLKIVPPESVRERRREGGRMVRGKAKNPRRKKPPKEQTVKTSKTH